MKRVHVQVIETRGQCSAGMKLGDGFILRDGTVITDVRGPLCIYAIGAIKSYLTAKAFGGAGWIETVGRLQCPDPENTVTFRVVAADEI